MSLAEEGSLRRFRHHRGVQASGIRLSELAGIRYDRATRTGATSTCGSEITVRGNGGKPRIVKISYDAARAVDRYLRARARHPQAWRAQLWLGAGSRGPLTASGIYQAVARRGREAGMEVWPHRFRHHFSHTWLDRGGPEGDLMELKGWSSPQMLARYGASARARRAYDRIMTDNP
jgi:integrase/recombinase XerD